MPVSPARIREIRKQLDDAARDLEGDGQYAELADVVAQAADAADQVVDERGAPRDPEPVQVGARVRRDDAPADETDDEDAQPASSRRNRKLPPQFRS